VLTEGEEFTCCPGAEVTGRGGDPPFPVDEHVLHHVLVSPQDYDVGVTVAADTAPDREVDGGASGNPPVGR